MSHGGGGKVKREENTVYLQAVSSLDSCPAWSWYLCLESACTLVGLGGIRGWWEKSDSLLGTPPNMPKIGAAGL